jgi:hypothetical protein
MVTIVDSFDGFGKDIFVLAVCKRLCCINSTGSHLAAQFRIRPEP